MIPTKEYISQLKSNGNGAIGQLVRKYNDGGTLTHILESLGHLPKNFDGSFLPDLLKHKI